MTLQPELMALPSIIALVQVLSLDTDFHCGSNSLVYSLTDHSYGDVVAGCLTQIFPHQLKPPVLPGMKHHLTLIGMNAHWHVMHNGVKETLTKLRSTYWLVWGNSLSIS